MLKILIQIIQMLLGEKVKIREPQPRASNPNKSQEKIKVDWNNSDSMISKYFTVKNATYLPSWKTYHIPNEEEKSNILQVAEKMDRIREFLGEPILVHVWIRPGKASCPGTEWDGMDYNEWLYKNVVWKNLTEEEKKTKKVPNSPHKTGKAVDWSIVDKKTADGCAEVRNKLLPKLEELDIRMEDIVGNWIHIDIYPVVSKRFFKP